MDSKKSNKTDGQDLNNTLAGKNIGAVFNLMDGDAGVFEVIRNSNQEIIDFSLLLPQNISSDGHNDSDGKNERGSDGKNGGRSDGHTLSRIGILPGSQLFNNLSQVLETGNTYELILPEHRDGMDHWFHVRINRFQTGILVSRENITRVKELEAINEDLQNQLFQKNRELQNLQAEIKTFNAIASNEYHDTLRNLYTSMEFIISTDARNLSNPGKANIRRAQVAIQKMKMLTEDIVSYLDIHADKANEEVDLNDVLSDVATQFRAKLQEIEGTIGFSELPLVRGYRHLLVILFTHLIDNAIKFRKDGSPHVIKIRSQIIPGNETGLPGSPPETQYALVSVSDNGNGFPEQEAEKIFELFYHQSGPGRKGSGIGLAICKKIMDIHHGMIRAECDPDCTTFYCYFPILNK